MVHWQGLLTIDEIHEDRGIGLGMVRYGMVLHWLGIAWCLDGGMA